MGRRSPTSSCTDEMSLPVRCPVATEPLGCLLAKPQELMRELRVPGRAPGTLRAGPPPSLGRLRRPACRRKAAPTSVCRSPRPN